MQKLLARFIIPVSFMMFVIGVGACQPAKSMKCDSINESALSDFPSTLTDPIELREWINSKYTNKIETLREYTDVSGAVWFYWSTDEKIYHASLGTNGAWLYYDWKSMKPRLREVIGCLGPPIFYEARDISGPYSAILFGIWYPANRLNFNTVIPGTTLAINENTVFTTLTITNIEDMNLRNLKPWPSDLSSFHLDSHK